MDSEAWFRAETFAEALQSLLRLNAGVTKLAFSQVNLARDQIAQLADALAVNTHVRQFKLTDCNIKDEGAISFAPALKRNETLLSLSLEGNQIGDRGARALLEAITSNESLTSLNLGRNDIGRTDCTWLLTVLEANQTLCLLDLTHNAKLERDSVRQRVRALMKRNQRPSRVLTLHAEPGLDGLSISCLSLAGIEVARLEAREECFRLAELRSALAARLCEPKTKLAFVLPCGMYLTRDDDKRHLVDFFPSARGVEV